jgi:hypothetical protein
VKNPSESCVYLIGAAGSTVAKIGKSTDVQGRRGALQTGSPVKLEILATVPGDIDLEGALHAHFEPQRLHGEWFDFGEMDRVESFRQALASIGVTEVDEPAVAEVLDTQPMVVDPADYRTVACEVEPGVSAWEVAAWAHRKLHDIRSTLLPDATWRMAQVAVALVENAKTHGAAPIRFELTLTDTFTVAVTDAGQRVPKIRRNGTGSLASIVREYAPGWNVERNPDGSKTVTARVVTASS